MSRHVRELNDILTRARAQGFQVELTRGSHYKITPPDARFDPIYTSSTPGDFRALRKIVGMLRKAGYTASRNVTKPKERLSLSNPDVRQEDDDE
jgi:hypothetical protein